MFNDLSRAGRETANKGSRWFKGTDPPTNFSSEQCSTIGAGFWPLAHHWFLFLALKVWAPLQWRNSQKTVNVVGWISVLDLMVTDGIAADQGVQSAPAASVLHCHLWSNAAFAWLKKINQTQKNMVGSGSLNSHVQSRGYLTIADEATQTALAPTTENKQLDKQVQK